MKFSKLLTPIAFICCTFLLFTGCDIGDSNSGGPKEVAVTMQVQSGQQAKLKAASVPTIQSVDSLSAIKLLVEELELESASDEDSLDFEAEDLVVNLPMDGSEFQLTSRTVPEGSYEEFEMEIEHDDDGQQVNDPDFYDEDAEYSVVVKGYYNGEAFTYRSEQDFEIELDLNPPLEITENSSSFAVNIRVNPDSWFVNPQNGEPLDPANSSHHELIDENIANSFDAESEEDDDDGDDDDDNDEDDDQDDDNDDDDDDGSDD